MNSPFALHDSCLYDLILEPASPWVGHLTRVTYPRGKILYQPGDAGDSLYLIHRGYVRTYRLSPEGREITFGLLGTKDVVGEMAVISGGRHNAFAEVLEDVELTIVPRATFETILQRQPEVAYRLMVQISQRLTQAENLIEDLVNRDVASRVARTLLQLGDTFGRKSARGTIIDLRLPYQEIANMVGSTRETVTRAISLMQQNNWVRLEAGRLHLLDSHALALLSA